MASSTSDSFKEGTLVISSPVAGLWTTVTAVSFLCTD
jgi:hypothetical protein